MEGKELTHFDEGPSRARWNEPPVWFAVTLAVFSAGAAGIHGSVMAEHFREDATFGVFFAVTSGLQLAWAVLVLIRPLPSLYLWGGVANTLIIATWAVSRTVGLPLGPEPGAPEAVTFVDIVATVLEVGLVAGCVLALRPRVISSLRDRREAFAAGVCVSILAGGAAILALASASTVGRSPDVGASATGHAVHLTFVAGAAGAALLGNVLADRVRARRGLR